jgi:RHS repeat-associated protein
MVQSGVGGHSKTTKINYGLGELRNDQQPRTYEELFPNITRCVSINGCSGPKTELFTVGRRINSVELPDGRKYQFRYNSYGDLARIETPVGGAFEYDYTGQFGSLNSNGAGYEGTTGEIMTQYSGIGAHDWAIARRVSVARRFSSSNQLETQTIYNRVSDVPVGNSPVNLVLNVETKDSSGVLMGQSNEYFSGNPANSFFHKVTDYNKPLEGKLLKTELLDVNGSPLNTVESSWSYTGSIDKPEIERVSETQTTLNDANLISKVVYGYDSRNNTTDLYEYDFGSGTVGAFLRRTHTDFMTTNPVNSVDYSSESVHQYRLPCQMWVSSDSSGNTRNALELTEYDNYTADSPHAGLTPRSSVIEHDSTNFGASYIPRGNVTSVTSYANAGAQTGAVSAFSQYDILGNVVETIDARGYASTIGYSDNFGSPDGESTTNTAPSQLNGSNTFAFPTSTTIQVDSFPLGWTTYAQFDYYTGSPVNTQDVNGVISKMLYNDLLDRPTQRVSAVGTALESQTTTVYDDTNHRLQITSDLNGLNDNLLKSESYYDGLGRVVETRKYEVGGGYVSVETVPFLTVQDPVTSVWRAANKTSNPYRPLAGETAIWTTSLADELGRPLKVITPDNAIVKTDYTGNATTVTDQAGKVRRSLTNALGQPTRIDEPNLSNQLGSLNTPNQATYYSYNTLGKMIRVQQGDQNRYFQYDSLGRMLRFRQPEQEINTALNTSGNPDNNSWTAGFTYDNNGNAVTTTDAKGTTITNVYDALNRPTSRSYNDNPTTPTVYFYYDGAGLDSVPDHSKGKLTKVSNSVSESRYTSFDLLGTLLSSEQRTPLDGETIATAIPRTSSYVYNLSGALIQETYPSGRTVKNDLDAIGDIARIYGQANSTATEKTFATGFSYMPDGKIGKLQLGNGLWESAKVNSRLQVTELAVGHSVGDGSLGKFEYAYGELQSDGTTVDATKNAGNIATQTMSFNGLTHPFVQAYKYDSLDRITEAKETVNGAQSWKQTFGNDRYGNRTSFYQIVGSQELSMNSLTLPTIDSAMNRFAAGQGYGYDKNGNVTTDPASSGRTFVFNGDNKQTEVKNSSNYIIGRYFYDGEGHRVKKVTDLETTVFVYDSSKLIAEYSTATPPSNPTTNYTATDQLGSPRILTDSLGQVVSRRDFMPFGEELYSDGTVRTNSNKYSTAGQDSVRQRFTGYQKDIETGLDFAEARYYDDQHGRFTAVDPLLASGKSGNPQTFNRYAYVMNRPLILADSTGLQAGEKPKKRTSKNPGDQLAKTYRAEMVTTASGDLVPRTGIETSNGQSSTAEVGTLKSGKETIQALKNLPSKKEDVALNTQCHGLTFTNGKVAIDNSQVDKLLTGEGMSRLGDTDAKRPADVAVYRDKDGNVVHTATVSETDDKGAVVNVSGLGGLQPKAHTDPPDKQYPLPKGGRIEYYRRTKDDRTDAERKADVERIKNYEKKP